MIDLPVIACIVEGDGEEAAVPVLVRRVVAEMVQPSPYVLAKLARKVNRSQLVRAGGIETTVEAVARQLPALGAIFVLIDADDDCPATLGPQLLARAQQARSDIPVAVVLAKKEYEAWFLAAATSLRGERQLPPDLAPPRNPEGIRDAKGWLSDRLPHNQRYRELTDQPALTALFDLQQARRADSFDKCYREIVRLITALT